MVAFPVRQRLNLPLVPLVAVLVAMAVGIAILLMPADILETLVMDSGVPALLPAAEPPLGLTARLALAITAAAGSCGLAWIALALTAGAGRAASPARDDAPDAVIPVLRRADAHPDAPARAPLLALRDLGAPFLDIRAPDTEPLPPPIERELPRDLEAPLAAFDPNAIPIAPLAAPPAVAPLNHRAPPPACDPGERFEVFDLPTPAPAPAGSEPPIAAPRTDATIHALLARLERGAERLARPQPAVARDAAGEAQGLEGTLAELRRLATR